MVEGHVWATDSNSLCQDIIFLWTKGSLLQSQNPATEPYAQPNN